MSISLICLALILTSAQPIIPPFDFLMGVVAINQLIERRNMDYFIVNSIGRWVEAFLGSPVTKDREMGAKAYQVIDRVLPT